MTQYFAKEYLSARQPAQPFVSRPFHQVNLPCNSDSYSILHPHRRKKLFLWINPTEHATACQKLINPEWQEDSDHLQLPALNNLVFRGERRR